ncbi:pyrroline-5-carboxylate reductase [Sporomusa acidovorans]|uniref:Pyrroline-5-carboxylate reductase n=1 Tax=Sporomusa acidovorans (strain ATCC 49682 / DSM 3132 / Mol) TaxID=1123286 RepID=A0ABZ3J3R6_SPOA4|nr:pyrroline-5-carboxylate reductase [Sporomusa acidovorans]OZC20249.1 pyrroline-5-carboxylate reductase [Sporomusa acidovorans DSM 3132]SDD40590.1 pyrroline-5-carboxylate reductase [Sporomusa acidovorans]
MLKNKQIGFIGGGAMAEALIRGILNAGLVVPSQILVSDVSVERLDYLRGTFTILTTTDSQETARQSDILFLTVKPQVINGVIDTIAPVVSKSTVLVTVAAGVTISTYQNKMPGVPIIRVMPNTPVAVGEGMSAMALGKYATTEVSKPVAQVFSSVGQVVTVSEDTMDAVTGLSGSGPAYAFVLIDALTDAGVRVGFSRQTAVLLAAQTLLGAAKMVLATGEHPAKLRDMVTSPGGTAITGVHILEQNGVRAALIDAVVAATNRSREMGRR